MTKIEIEALSLDDREFELSGWNKFRLGRHSHFISFNYNSYYFNIGEQTDLNRSNGDSDFDGQANWNVDLL